MRPRNDSVDSRRLGASAFRETSGEKSRKRKTSGGVSHYADVIFITPVQDPG
jgi:hypothetical protein